LETNDFATVADITLSYYDKAYNHGLEKREGQTIHSLELEKDNPVENARLILEFYKNLEE